ncbi:MAG: hypothetical protein O3B76_07595 [Proteobacteria bacterium]|nr:hypothetical protein [Pseudomonadota bacterium]MDA1022188.1 hypothetical protein [Pseudomonadota bacterium]
MSKLLSKEQKNAMKQLCAGMKTKSDKIRTLGSADYTRSDIARFLDIRYQHVRNVLERAKEKEEKKRSPELEEGPPEQIWTQVGPDGRVVVPAAYRQFLGIEEGGPVLMMLDKEEVRLIGRDTAIARVQDMVAKYVPEGVSLVDELLAERRREVKREEQEEGVVRVERKHG